MAPCGPCVVPAQFIEDTNGLRILLYVNDRKMMDASADQILYKVDEILSVISDYITIEPGDMVMTGSPSGSAGVHGNCWLKPGDRIHAELGHGEQMSACATIEGEYRQWPAIQIIARERL
jgi:2,4-didehydro-3-deoxy-L-rhamnonate hydrolase